MLSSFFLNFTIAFSIPTFLYVRSKKQENGNSKKLISNSFIAIKNTFSEIKKYKQVTRFLLARIIYNDAIITVIALAYLGILMSLHFIYFVGCLVVSLLLVYKYKMVKPDDLSKLGMAFMRINAFVSTSILIATIFAIVIG